MDIDTEEEYIRPEGAYVMLANDAVRKQVCALCGGDTFFLAQGDYVTVAACTKCQTWKGIHYG